MWACFGGGGQEGFGALKYHGHWGARLYELDAQPRSVRGPGEMG